MKMYILLKGIRSRNYNLKSVITFTVLNTTTRLQIYEKPNCLLSNTPIKIIVLNVGNDALNKRK